ncbi:SapB/AmfS family lanthipeptide [Streptomyces kaempferi]
MHGASGTALLLLHLHQVAADSNLLDLAGRALEHDLARCVVAEDGTLQVDDGIRVLPYLESGSAGIAAVLQAHLKHRPDAGLAEQLERIGRAAVPEFIVQPGLFNGRAGLIGLQALLDPDATERAGVIRRHVRRLLWHVVPYEGHPAFPGEQLLRLSMDLATGNAGVMTALGSVYAGTPTLPFLTVPTEPPNPSLPRPTPPGSAHRPAHSRHRPADIDRLVPDDRLRPAGTGRPAPADWHRTTDVDRLAPDDRHGTDRPTVRRRIPPAARETGRPQSSGRPPEAPTTTRKGTIMSILSLQALETPEEILEYRSVLSSLSAVNCTNSTVSTLLCL